MRKVINLTIAVLFVLNCSVHILYADEAHEILFEDVTHNSGLQRIGPSFSAAVADYDRDGFADVAISNHKDKGNRVELYHNGGNGVFSAVPFFDSYVDDIDPHGISWLDVNGDGWLDVYLSCGANRGMGTGDNQIFLNRNGVFKFSDYGELLADATGGSRSSAPWDFDNDGVVDLIMMNHVRPGRGQHIAVQRQGTFVDFAEKTGWQDRQAESVRIAYLDDSQKPYFILQTGGVEAGMILRQNDQGIFENVSAQLGVTPGVHVQSVLPFDFDNDGDLDLYYVLGPNWVSSMPEVHGARLSFFYSGGNEAIQGVRFRVEGKLEVNALINGEIHPEYIKLGYGKKSINKLPFVVDVNDNEINGKPKIDSERDFGIFIWKDSNGDIILWFVGKEGTYSSASTGSITCLDTKPVLLECIGGAISFSSSFFVNRLYENRDGYFVDVTEKARVGDNGPGTDALAADFDNDGDLDLYVINGGDPYRNPPNVMYRNNGNGAFENVTARSQTAGPETGRSDTAVAFDYDNDGDLDMLLLNGNGPPPVSDEGPRILWRNNSRQGNWLDVELSGTKSNLWAMGARVIVLQRGRKLLQQRLSTTTRFATSLSPLHFGMGDSKEAELLAIWPSGRCLKKLVKSNKRILLVEPSE